MDDTVAMSNNCLHCLRCKREVNQPCVPTTMGPKLPRRRCE